MRWLERHSWWGLVAIAVVFALFGVTDIAGGAAADVVIPLALAGLRLEEFRRSPGAQG